MNQAAIQVLISEQNFDVAQQYTALCEVSPRAGAVVFFVGLVRDLYQDKLDQDKVEYLELQHYKGMTETLCHNIIDQACARFPCDAVRLVHRVGKIHAGEQIVMVSVASRHRDNAFQAAQFIMDYLKTEATFWKKEVGARGEQWLGIKDKDQSAAQKWSAHSKK